MKEVISTEKVPAAIGSYSQGIMEDFYFCSEGNAEEFSIIPRKLLKKP